MFTLQRPLHFLLGGGGKTGKVAEMLENQRTMLFRMSVNMKKMQNHNDNSYPATMHSLGGLGAIIDLPYRVVVKIQWESSGTP